MKFSQSINIRFLFTARILAVLMCVGLLSISIDAQKLLLAASASLEQCRNGDTGAPVGCVSPGGATGWVTGNAGFSNSHWAENQFLAYRMLFDGLTPGATVHTVEIGYDIIKGGPHAIDYLGTFNDTEATADPCASVSGCTLGLPTSTIPITADTVTVTNNINPNTGMPIVQLPGQFTMWGGNLLSFSYTSVNVGGGDTERTVTLTFTASVANPVLAWSGHVGWIGDWGAGNSAGGISGSPYHMRLIAFDGQGGNQDRSLSADAVTASGAVFIKKVVNTLFPTPGTASTTVFSFTAGANFGPTSFSLVDDDGGPGIDTQQGQTITSFGPGNTITVTETPIPNGWTISDVNCVESGLQDSTKSPSLGPSASIIVQLAEVVTCTFTNTQQAPSAADVSISGRVVTSDGTGISNARLTVINAATGEAKTSLTNPFGFYAIDDLAVGQFYILRVSHKRYTFAEKSRTFTLNDDIADVDFIANP